MSLIAGYLILKVWQSTTSALFHGRKLLPNFPSKTILEKEGEKHCMDPAGEYMYKGKNDSVSVVVASRSRLEL
jgi:hypothetical protein